MMTHLPTNPEKPAVVAAETLAEAQRLFADMSWSTRDSVYVEGKMVCILVDPLPAAQPGRFHVPITVLPLRVKVEHMEGLSVLLRDMAGDSGMYYGHLTGRGQLLMRDLPDTQCRMVLAQREDVREFASLQLAQETLKRIHLSTTRLAYSVKERAGGQDVFRTADGTLSATVGIDANGKLTLEMRSTTRAREADVAVLGWMAHQPGIDTDQPPQLLLLPFLWDAEAQACRAEILLSSVPASGMLWLPDQVWPADQLTEDLAGAVQDSMQSAATGWTMQAWRSLYDQKQETLAMGVRRAIEAGIQPGQPALWTAFERAGARLMRLSTEIRITLSQNLARFQSWPASLSPVLVPMPLSRREASSEPSHIQVLYLESPEQDLSIKLTPGPVEGSAASLTLEALTRSTQDPLRRVRVSIRDRERALLESDLTGEDGRIAFAGLRAESYVVELRYQGTVWEVPITFLR